MTGALLRRTFGRVGALFGALTLLLALFQLALVAIAASLAGANAFDRIAELTPVFFQQTFGLALASFSGLASIGFFEPLVVMLVVEFAIYLGTEIAGDVEFRFVDLLLARPLARHALVTRSLVVMTSATVVLPLVMAASLWVNLHAFAPPGASWPDARTVVLLTSHLAAVGWCFGGLALAVASGARRRGAAQAIVGIGAVALYLLDFVGSSWSSAQWLSPLSPFHYFQGADVLAGRANTAHDLAVLLCTGTAGVVAAYWQFGRRDL